MSDAVAFACFRVLFVAHNKRMKELLPEHIVTLFNLNYGVAVEKASLRKKNNPSTSLKQSLKKENNPSCICSKDWASSQKLRRMFSRCINTMARSSALPVLMLPKVIACNPDKDIFDIGREAIGCDWIELVEAEPLAKDGLLMMIDEEGKLKPGGALINAAASALYGTEQHGDPIMGNAVIVRTTGENLELLTFGEAEQLAVRMEAVRDSALQKIAEAFARRPTSKQERSTSSLPRRQPCRKDNLER